MGRLSQGDEPSMDQGSFRVIPRIFLRRRRESLAVDEDSIAASNSFKGAIVILCVSKRTDWQAPIKVPTKHKLVGEYYVMLLQFWLMREKI